MKIMTTGTFDLYHYGHLNLLKRAQERGDYLIVGLNSDELISHKKPINDYETRIITMFIILSIAVVVLGLLI